MSSTPLTLREVLRRSAEHLAARGCESPRLDAELLLGKALGLSQVELYLDLDRPLTASELDASRELVGRRGRREPLQYVLGEWGFRRLTLTVDRRALIPRPETEVVVERCLDLLRAWDEPRVLDIGTGSGAIGLAIADEHPGARVTGLDASDESLALARENAERTGLTLELHRGDLFEALPAGPWELVVSNPPYVAPGDRGALAPEVVDWEPEAALFGDRATEAVARGALDVLAPDGALVLEVADGQARQTAELLRELGYREVQTTRDLAGSERVVEGRQ